MKFAKYANIETELNKKYISKNPVIVFLNNYFLSTIASLVKSAESSRILDIGCGEGIVTHFLIDNLSINSNHIVGLDIKGSCLKIAQGINPEVQFFQASIYKIPFQDNSFDLVLGLEVLEHLEFPEKAIGELNRVSKNWVIVSVPNDRMFRIGNMFRFKYLSSWGATPDHIQHWDKKTFKNLISRYLDIAKTKAPFLLWLVLLCQAKNED